MRRVAIVVLGVALFCGAAFAYANLAGQTESVKHSPKRRALSISGHVTNLQPGIPTTLRVKVRNNLRHPVRMRSLKLVIADGGPDCPNSILTAAPVRTHKSLKPRRTYKLPVTVTLSSSAPDACQGATFPIKYQARASLRRGAH